MHYFLGGCWELLTLICAEPMYGDFFDPPPGMAPTKSPVRVKAGRVRFHEEVKVKKIKPKGKGLPVNTPAYWGEEVGDDEDFEGFGDDGGLLNGHLDLDQDYEQDSEDDDDDDDDDMDEDEDEDEDDDDEDEDSEEDDQEAGQRGRQAVERIKDDLFAEEDSEEQSGGGKSDGFEGGLSLTFARRPHESPEAYGGFEGADRSPGGGKRCSQEVDPFR